MNVRTGIFLIGLFFLCGCAKIAHLQELLAIKRYSDNQTLQDEFIWQAKEKFDLLLQKINSGEMAQYTDRKTVLRDFGEPVFSKEVSRNGQMMERWLYRHPVHYFHSEKVYFYFDDGGHVTGWEHIVPSSKEDSHV